MEHFDSTGMKLDQKSRHLRQTIMLIFFWETLFWKFKDETELWQKKERVTFKTKTIILKA